MATHMQSSSTEKRESITSNIYPEKYPRTTDNCRLEKTTKGKALTGGTPRSQSRKTNQTLLVRRRVSRVLPTEGGCYLAEQVAHEPLIGSIFTDDLKTMKVGFNFPR